MSIFTALNQWADRKWAEVNASIPHSEFFSIDIKDVESRSKADWANYYRDLRAVPKDLIVSTEKPSSSEESPPSE